MTWKTEEFYSRIHLLHTSPHHFGRAMGLEDAKENFHRDYLLHGFCKETLPSFGGLIKMKDFGNLSVICTPHLLQVNLV